MKRPKKSGVRVSNGRQCDQKLGVLSIEPYVAMWDSVCSGPDKKLLETAAQPRIIGSEKRCTVITGFEPATLKSDPFPGEHSTSSSDDERALSESIQLIICNHLTLVQPNLL